MQCQEFEPKIVLYLCDELEVDEIAALESHLNTCAECAAFAKRERVLLRALAERGQPEADASLLAQCRMDLSEAIERAGAPGLWPRLTGRIAGGLSAVNLSLRDWMTARPAWSAAVFVLAGVTVAILAPRVIEGTPEAGVATTTPGAVMMVRPEDPSTRITGISFQPAAPESGAPLIQVQGTAQTPFVDRGTIDDVNIRRALMQVAQNSQQFNSDARMDSLELLKSRGNDAEVRQALCAVARRDRNPGVRLKALEALLEAQHDELVRQTLIDALLNDQNPGVRVAAVNGLQSIAASSEVRSDDRMLQVLRDRMEKDPNTYIRLQSAAAVRQLAQRGVY